MDRRTFVTGSALGLADIAGLGVAGTAGMAGITHADEAAAPEAVTTTVAADGALAVLYNCKLVKLVHDEEGVKGGICDYQGNIIQINATHTLIAAGGYPASAESIGSVTMATVTTGAVKRALRNALLQAAAAK